MTFRPICDRILIRWLEAPGQGKGGIIIPDTAKEKPQGRLVIATENGKLLEKYRARVELSVRAGDGVLFAKYSGTDVKIDGYELPILREDDILVITKGAAR